MYVVRIEAGEKTDFKAFSLRSDADDRFWAAAGKVLDGEFDTVALFLTTADDARKAVHAVKSGNAADATLLEKCPPWSRNSGVLDELLGL